MISKELKRFGASLSYAFSGLKELWTKEKNTRIHLFFTIAVIIAAFVFRVSLTEWAILVLTIMAVWSAETMNSALERAVDLETQERKPLAKAAKDLAAGAVLILAMGSVVIGMIIFLPKILKFLY